jgi:hypothetical protein
VPARWTHDTAFFVDILSGERAGPQRRTLASSQSSKATLCNDLYIVQLCAAEYDPDSRGCQMQNRSRKVMFRYWCSAATSVSRPKSGSNFLLQPYYFQGALEFHDILLPLPTHPILSPTSPSRSFLHQDAFSKGPGRIPLLAGSSSTAIAVSLSRHPAVPLVCGQSGQGPRDGRVDLRRHVKTMVEKDWRFCRAG